MTRNAMYADLKRSGLSARHAKSLKLKVLTASQTKALGHFEVPSYQIKYYDIRGKATGYYRVRYLEKPKGEFGRELPREARYSGPADVMPEAYFPKVIKWSNPVPTDISVTIWLTEGEKKATAACLAGVHCIALGGVAMFQSKKRGVDFLPELEAFTWKGRKVIIAYDSDKSTNANIVRDQNALATRLLERGADVFICDIPPTADGEKVGLDDYLLSKAKTDKQRAAVMLFLEHECSSEYAMSELLHKLNDEVAFIRERGAVYVFMQNALVDKLAKLAKLEFGTWYYEIPATSEHGKPREVNAFEQWLRWEQRREHNDIVYAPGRDALVDGNLNVWSGWGVEPKAGDVKPFVEIVNFLFRDTPDALKRWFWQWLAYPIQYPGTKLYSAVVLHGPVQGTGKTFLGEIVGDIYGENFSLLEQDDLTDKFNDAFVRKQFALGDEIVSANNRREANKLKTTITRQSIPINRKFEAKYSLRDTINYLFTSNHFDAVHLERFDRRYAIVRVPDETLPTAFYKRLRSWRNAGGAAALHAYLLGIDTSNFEPTGPPPSTDAHIDMIESSFSDLDQWAEDLKTTPDRILQMNGVVSTRALFEPTELLTLYDPGKRRGTSARALANALKGAGFSFGRARSKRYGGTIRLWAVREPGHWAKRVRGEWAKEFDSYHQTSRREKLT